MSHLKEEPVAAKVIFESSSKTHCGRFRPKMSPFEHSKQGKPMLLKKCRGAQQLASPRNISMAWDHLIINPLRYDVYETVGRCVSVLSSSFLTKRTVKRRIKNIRSNKEPVQGRIKTRISPGRAHGLRFSARRGWGGSRARTRTGASASNRR